MNKVAAYCGSFDPFTKGHLSVYLKAKELFSDVVIVVANNPQKKRFTNVEEMADMIRVATGATVVVESGLVALYCKRNGIKHSVRGLRGTSDYLYEEELSKANKLIYSELDTVYFRAEDDGISSTLVRLLHEQGEDADAYLPDGVTLGGHDRFNG